MADLPIGTVTFLFTDIEGSTRLWEQHPQAMPVALARHDAILREATAAYGGVVFRTVGDAFCTAFASAPAALRVALDAQGALQAEPWGETGPIRVRMAVHTGAVEIRDGEYQGQPLNRLARLLAAGHGGQTLLSAAAVELVRDDLPPGVELRDMGAHRLKDLSRPEHIFQIVAPDQPNDFPALKTLDRRPHNLPAQPTALIGREKEVASVCSLLRRADARLVTLTGPGGTGKTRLGLQVAAELLDDFKDGVWFVNLAPISDSSLVAATAAQTLGIKESASRSLLDHLKDYLYEKQLLLLLDNFEQVAEAAPLVGELLAVAPGLKVLATSRMPLHLSGEREYAVPPLGLPPQEPRTPSTRRFPSSSRGRAGKNQEPSSAAGATVLGSQFSVLFTPAELTQYEAVRLFIERAQAVKADFALTNENVPAVAEICHWLDGLPLAIELAATRTKLFAPESLLKRLEKRLPLLTGGARDLPARQQTLRNAIEWSYQLLDVAEQTLFRRLAVFVGGCTLEAVEVVSNAAGNLGLDVLDGLTALVDQSLLRQGDGLDGEPRFAMLETIREYALEQLQQSGELDVIRRCHASFFLTLAQAAEPHLRSTEQQVWLARLDQEHNNLRAALTWSQAAGDIGLELQLVGALWQFWNQYGYWIEGRSWLERVLARSQGVPAAVRAKILVRAGTLAWRQGDYERATALFDESLTLYRKLDDQQGISVTLYSLGLVAAEQSDYERAQAFTEESLALCRRLGHRTGIARSISHLGDIVFAQGQYERAGALFEESLALFRQLGHGPGIAHALHSLGAVAWYQDKLEQAVVLLEESLALFRRLANKEGTAWALIHLGDIALLQGDERQARSLAAESLGVFEEIGYRDGIIWALHGLARGAKRQGDIAQAQRLYQESLALCQALNDKLSTAICLEGLAGLAATENRPVRAARLWGAAAALCKITGAPLPPHTRTFCDHDEAAVRAQLDEATFATAWQAGRIVPLEQAIAEALEVAAEVPSPAPTSPSAPQPAVAATGYPAGLTAREVEVLRLVAQGLTDVQVAERLIVSAHTVHAHLRSIYSKLEVTSRAAATRFAVDQRLI